MWCQSGALSHRDYTRLGAVHVRWNDAELSISSPGGFVDGVTLENLLVVELCQLSPDQATRLLHALVAEGKLARHGERKGATYARA